VAEIEQRIRERTRSAVGGAVNRAARTRRPRTVDIDWLATIGRNLDHYLPEHRTVVPERLVGHARNSKALACDVVIAIDQSSSMAESVVYASVFGAVLGSLRTLRTSLVAFDTAVVDLTELLEDPVEVLFGCQLGGGTDINRAVAYCADLVTRPTETVFLLITDLYEGGDGDELMRRLAALHRAGVRVVVLLALSDGGAPAYDTRTSGGPPTFRPSETWLTHRPAARVRTNASRRCRRRTPAPCARSRGRGPRGASWRGRPRPARGRGPGPWPGGGA
jgi:hypothetical protein